MTVCLLMPFFLWWVLSHEKEALEEEAFKNKALEKKPPPGMLKRQSTGAIDPSTGMQVVKAEPKNEARFEDGVWGNTKTVTTFSADPRRSEWD